MSKGPGHKRAPAPSEPSHPSDKKIYELLLGVYARRSYVTKMHARPMAGRSGLTLFWDDVPAQKEAIEKEFAYLMFEHGTGRMIGRMKGNVPLIRPGHALVDGQRYVLIRAFEA